MKLGLLLLLSALLAFTSGAFLGPLLYSYEYDLPFTDPLTHAMFPHDTQFSRRFSESSFQRLSIGMSKEDVQDSLGSPIDIKLVCRNEEERFLGYLPHPDVCEGENPHKIDRSSCTRLVERWSVDRSTCDHLIEVWSYALPGSRFNHYYERDVQFNGDGTLIATRSFYLD